MTEYKKAASLIVEEMESENGRKAERRKGGATVYHPVLVATSRILDILEELPRAYRATVFRQVGEIVNLDVAAAVPERDRLPESDPFA